MARINRNPETTEGDWRSLPREKQHRATKAEGEITAARIRELLKKHSVGTVAKLTGNGHSRISRIKSGKIWGNKLEITIDSLQLRFVVPAKLCRRCAEPSTLFTGNHLCVACEIRELHKRKLVQIETTT